MDALTFKEIIEKICNCSIEKVRESIDVANSAQKFFRANEMFESDDIRMFTNRIRIVMDAQRQRQTNTLTHLTNLSQIKDYLVERLRKLEEEDKYISTEINHIQQTKDEIMFENEDMKKDLKANLDNARNKILCYKLLTNASFEYGHPSKTSGIIENNSSGKIIGFEVNSGNFDIYSLYKDVSDGDWSDIIDMEP